MKTFSCAVRYCIHVNVIGNSYIEPHEEIVIFISFVLSFGLEMNSSRWQWAAFLNDGRAIGSGRQVIRHQMTLAVFRFARLRSAQLGCFGRCIVAVALFRCLLQSIHNVHLNTMNKRKSITAGNNLTIGFKQKPKRWLFWNAHFSDILGFVLDLSPLDMEFRVLTVVSEFCEVPVCVKNLVLKFENLY